MNSIPRAANSEAVALVRSTVGGARALNSVLSGLGSGAPPGTATLTRTARS